MWIGPQTEVILGRIAGLLVNPYSTRDMSVGLTCCTATNTHFCGILKDTHILHNGQNACDKLKSLGNRNVKFSTKRYVHTMKADICSDVTVSSNDFTFSTLRYTTFSTEYVWIRPLSCSRRSETLRYVTFSTRSKYVHSAIRDVTMMFVVISELCL